MKRGTTKYFQISQQWPPESQVSAEKNDMRSSTDSGKSFPFFVIHLQSKGGKNWSPFSKRSSTNATHVLLTMIFNALQSFLLLSENLYLHQASCSFLFCISEDHRNARLHSSMRDGLSSIGAKLSCFGLCLVCLCLRCLTDCRLNTPKSHNCPLLRPHFSTNMTSYVPH